MFAAGRECSALDRHRIGAVAVTLLARIAPAVALARRAAAYSSTGAAAAGGRPARGLRAAVAA
ncbi:hypothetical protein JTP67_37515, partial [Streptomyces sp. S12]|nr:hypothetical protein [Streptomyces sp. S12]